MVYKYKGIGRLDPEKGVNKPFKKFSGQGRTQKFFREGTKFKCIFSGKISLKQIQEQKRL